MSVGDLVMGAMGGGTPGQQINQALSGGGGGTGGTQMPQGGALAGPQATQSPPDLANLYVKLMQQTRNAHDFDRNMALFAGGFKGPPGGADRLMNSVAPQQDAGSMLQNLMQMKYMQNIQNAPVPTMGGGAAGGQAGGGGGQPIVSPQQWAIMTPQQKQELMSKVADSNIQTAQSTTEDANKDKLGAKETFASLDPQYKTAEDTVGWLQAHPDATIKAVQMGNAAGGITGQLGGMVGLISADVRDARAKLNQLNDENFRAGLANVKNVRSQSEANKVGGSVSSLDNRSNSPEMIQTELGRLGNVVRGARGNLMGAAGKEIPSAYSGLVDQSYLDPTSPIYNGSKMETPPQQQKEGGGGEGFNYAAIPSGTVYTAPDGTQRKKP